MEQSRIVLTVPHWGNLGISVVEASEYIRFVNSRMRDQCTLGVILLDQPLLGKCVNKGSQCGSLIFQRNGFVILPRLMGFTVCLSSALMM